MEIRLPARLENLEALVRFVSDCAGASGFGSKQTRRIELATEETLMNIFTHAYPDGSSGNVVVGCQKACGKDFRVTFKDRGVTFDMATFRPANLSKSVAEREIGGVGIVLIRRMADQIEYQREMDQNILTLIFHAS